MNTGHSQYRLPEELKKEYIDNTSKLESHYCYIMEKMITFIRAMEWEIGVDVNIDELGLGYALVDYFEDVRRMKEFHRCEHISSIKIVSYLSYWLLKRHILSPLSNRSDLLYLNELFVLSEILIFLGSKDKPNIVLDKRAGIVTFYDTLFYYLKYRVHDAHDIEMIITAFLAGRVYQSTGDISDTLPESDYESEEDFLAPTP